MPAGSVNYKMAEQLRRAKPCWSDGRKPYDPFDDLRCAIVLQAMDDWLMGQSLIKKRHDVNDLQELRAKFPGKEDWEKVCTLRIQYMADAERFFNSEYCEDLCGVPGKLILHRMKNGETLPAKSRRYVKSRKHSQKIQVA